MAPVKVLLFVVIFLMNSLIIGCGGGGGGSSSGSSVTPITSPPPTPPGDDPSPTPPGNDPPPPPEPDYLMFVSSMPNDESTNVGTNSNIVLEFSEIISVSNALIGAQQISSLLEEEGIGIFSRSNNERLEDSDINQVGDIDLDRIVFRYLNMDKDDPASLVLASGFDFVSVGEDTYELHIFVINGAAIVFSEDQLERNMVSPINTSLIRLREGENEISGTATMLLEQITFRPSRDLKFDTTYEIVIDKSLSSYLGNTLEEDVVLSFTTQSAPVPSVVSFSHEGLEVSPIENIEIVTSLSLLRSSIPASYDPAIDSDPTLQLYKINGAGREPVGYTTAYSQDTRTITVTPSEDLEYAADYIFVFNANNDMQVISGSDNILDFEESVEFNFSTANPKVESATPSTDLNAYSVATNRLIQVEMNFVALPESVNSESILVERIDSSGGRSSVAMESYSVNSNTGRITITPRPRAGGRSNDFWDYQSNYEVTLTTAIQSNHIDIESRKNLFEEYKFTFSTEGRQVSAVSPRPNSEEASTGLTGIAIEFNFNVDESSLDDGITVIAPLGDFAEAVVQGRWTYDAEIRTARFLPSDPLLPLDSNVDVTVRVGEGVRAESGELIDSTYEWDFETFNDVLEITSFYPQGNLVPANATIEVIFNHELDRETIVTTGSFKSIRARYTGGCFGDIDGSVRFDGNRTLYFDPNDFLKPFCPVEVTVEGDIRGSRNQNQSDSGFDFAFDDSTWTFTTTGLTVQSVTYQRVNSRYTQPNQDLAVVSTDLVFEFSHPINPVSVFSNEIELVECFEASNICTGTHISGQITISGRSVRFNPDRDLDYGQRYRLSFNDLLVESTTGEQLAEEFEFFFETEVNPTYIVDWGPEGRGVPVDSIPFILFDREVSGSEFPTLVTNRELPEVGEYVIYFNELDENFRFVREVSFTLREDGRYIDLDPIGNLDELTNYEIEVIVGNTNGLESVYFTFETEGDVAVATIAASGKTVSIPGRDLSRACSAQQTCAKTPSGRVDRRVGRGVEHSVPVGDPTSLYERRLGDYSNLEFLERQSRILGD